MKPFADIDSSDSLSTNLQLYSLEQAAHNWNALVNEIRQKGATGVDRLKERIVFIASCLGLSLSQLIGQNSKFPEHETINSPTVLLGPILEKSSLDPAVRRRLDQQFKRFYEYYGTIRHFGKNKGRTKHRQVEAIGLAELDQFKDMTIKIWDATIERLLKKSPTFNGETRSILSQVPFEQLPVSRP